MFYPAHEEAFCLSKQGFSKQGRREMERSSSIILSFLAFMFLLSAHLLLSAQAQDQQRQIDQLNSMMLTMGHSQESTEEGTVMSAHRDYDFLFANFSKRIAVLNSAAPTPKKGEKYRYTIVRNVPLEVLKEWNKN